MKRAGRHVLTKVSLLEIFPKEHFLTKYDQLPKPEICAGEVNVQHRTRNETLDPRIRSSVCKPQSELVEKNDPRRFERETS